MKILVVFIIFSISQVLTNPVGGNEDEPEVQQTSEHSHPYGGPINLMKFDEHENVIIDEDSLERTFNHPLVKDRKIVAVSIIGAFRKGKSFLMDYALRYMYANYKSVAFPDNPLTSKTNWVGNLEEPLTGFTWRGGASRDTTGVVLWSDVFLDEQKDPKTKKIEKLAIILMDTQGLFDTKTSATDNSRIFALGTLISSVQIFNLNDVIQENQLEYLHMATDFAKFAMKQHKKYSKGSKNYKPFQTLIFLMRDWQNVVDFEYGNQGGAEYLAQVLNIDPKQPKTLQDVRKYIKESFDQRLCFLMPHPGFEVVNNNNYDGRFSALSEDFQTQLKDFLYSLLQPKNLKKKKILNNEVVGTEYLEYLKVYFEAFQSNEIPKIDTLHGITVRKQYDIVMTEAFIEYQNILGGITIDIQIGDQWKEKNVLEQEMNQIHQNAKQNAIKIFKDKKKLGSEADEKKYEDELRAKLETKFNEWKAFNFNKYQELKTVDEANKIKLSEMKNETDIKIQQEQELARIEREKLEREHQEKTNILEGTIQEVRNKTTEEIKILQAEFNKTQIEAERQRQLLLDQLENEKLQIKKKAKDAEIQLKNQLDSMQQEMRKKEELIKKEIEDKKEEKIEMLRIKAEERKMELERQTIIEANRAQIMAAQREAEKERIQEERSIRKQAEIQKREERKRADREQREAFQLFQQQIAESRIQAQREEREARERSDRQMQMIMANANAKPKEDSGTGTIWAVVGGIAAASLFLG
ncbi:unnamed protein product [Chironomus riparius]|uniref:GB1/RHD3-type G domain-containing protein n=1 Tax=Chironomus riparius TaxID=315576 RepID=A0A9N9S4I0_9DIPT|nr:unnamed protein product [Chironomus riparius]